MSPSLYTPDQYEMPMLVGKGGEKDYAVNYKPVGLDDLTTPSQEEHLSKRRSSVTPRVPTHNALVLRRRRRFLNTFRALRTALLPIVAIVYLVFCYTVHYKVVQVKARIFDDTAANFSIIKSGVTSISILIITLGLLPVQSLIADLKGEEFFRVLSRTESGVPLSSVNAISTPSFGIIDSVTVLIRRHCSPYFAVSFFTGLLLLATSTLAPAALSVSTAWFDGDIMALAVGAIPRDSVFNSSGSVPMPASIPSNLYARASTVAWVENVLGVEYPPMIADPKRYIVPPPLNLPGDVTARWLSDVIVMQPECIWSRATSRPDLRSGFGTNGNPADPDRVFIDLEQGVSINYDISLFSPLEDAEIAYRSTPWSITNTSDTGFPRNGAAVWFFSQCSSNCSTNPEVTLNLTGILTFPIKYETKTFDTAFLLCSPHATVETREVRNDGHALLNVLDTPHPIKMGNLHEPQVQALFTFALQDLGQNGGPLTISGLGPEIQVSFMFGPAATNVTIEFGQPVVTFTPLPLADISAGFTGIIASSMKLMLQGNISTAYVPARMSTQLVIFTSSLPQVIATTVLFTILLAVMGVAFFRRDMPQFTLYSVASSLDGSSIPPTFSQVRNESDSSVDEGEMIDTFGGRSVMLSKTSVKYGTLQLE